MKVEIDVWNEQTSIKCPKTERLRVRLSDGMCCRIGCPDLDCPLGVYAGCLNGRSRIF